MKTEDECLYAWEIDDPSLEPLFQKHLSKHSVRAYMLLHREVGQKFRAVLAKVHTVTLQDNSFNLTRPLIARKADGS